MNKVDEARRERDRARKAAERLRNGMVPQSKRNVSKLMGEIAHASGAHLSTLYRHRKAGTLDAFLFDPESLRKKCPLASQDDAKDLSARFGLSEKDLSARNSIDEKVLSKDNSFARSGISQSRWEEHNRTVEKLVSESNHAQSEWLDTLPRWSMT